MKPEIIVVSIYLVCRNTAIRTYPSHLISNWCGFLPVFLFLFSNFLLSFFCFQLVRGRNRRYFDGERNRRYFDGEERPLFEIKSLWVNTLVNWESRESPYIESILWNHFYFLRLQALFQTVLSSYRQS